MRVCIQDLFCLLENLTFFLLVTSLSSQSPEIDESLFSDYSTSLVMGSGIGSGIKPNLNWPESSLRNFFVFKNFFNYQGNNSSFFSDIWGSKGRRR